MIDEATIMTHLDLLLNGSEPGATMHSLHVLRAPAGAVGPLGMPDPAAIQSIVYAIAPSGDVDVEQFVAKVVLHAGVEAHGAGEVPLFAALSQEVWTVPVLDALARELLAAGRLFEHPRAVEMTVVYAACRDGRRWTGRRLLTGPEAGTTHDVELLVGRPGRGEGFGPSARLVRMLVGV